ncbi:MAG: hypothetical protein Q9178_003891 [Gyalolechia marmorata]
MASHIVASDLMASEYISEKEILNYRTLTSLLAHTEFVEETGESTRSHYLTLDERPPSKDKSRFTALSSFTTLMVRDKEVVAVLPCGERPTLVDVTVLQEPDQSTLTRNPRQDDAAEAGTGMGKRWLPKLRASFLETSHELLTIKDNFGSAFLRHSGNVPFEVHCQFVTNLLKLNRSSPTKNARKRTAGTLTAWIIRVCNPKMIKRLNAGISESNFWEHLTEITEENMARKDPEFQDVKAKTLSSELPTPMQARFLKRQQTIGRIGQDWNERQPVFDRLGRQRIRKLLSELLLQVRASLEGLKEFLASDDAARAINLEDSDPRFGDALTQAREHTNRVHKSLNSLSQFLENFNQEVLRTCRWIANLFNLRRTSNVIPTLKTGKKSPASSPLTASSSSVGASSLPVKATRSESEAQEAYQGTGVEDTIERADTSEGRKRRWADEVLKWMEDLCLYVRALQSLTLLKSAGPGQRRLNNFIAKVAIKIVSVKPDRQDRMMKTYDAFMEDLDLHPLLFNREKIKNWLCAQSSLSPDGWRGSGFNGTWHCETILLSLQNLSLANLTQATSTHDNTASMISKALEDSATVPADIIEVFFKNRGSMLMVSERCCPSCQDLAQILDNISEPEYKYPRIYPGRHGAWSPVSLPPWLSPSLGKALTDLALVDLKARFKKIGELIKQNENVRKRSISAATDLPTETEEPCPKRQKPGLSQID